MPNVLLMGPDGILEDAFVQAAGEASEGTFVTFGGRTPASYTGAALDWLQRYRQQFGADPPVYAIYGYEATRVALDAVQRAGVRDRGEYPRRSLRHAGLRRRAWYVVIRCEWRYVAHDDDHPADCGRQIRASA